MTVTGKTQGVQIFNQNKVVPEAYFERINFSGSIEPTLATLRDLHIAHTKAIPFENLNPLLRLPVALDIDSIQTKIISRQRGGYCFEQNILFSEVLKTLGFKVTGLAARVMWNVAEGVVPARGHMLLLIRLNGINYIADTGFGSLTLPEPLIFEPGLEQITTHESFRIMAHDEEFVLEANVKGEWKGMYRFTLAQQLLPDYEVTNYYLSTNNNSHFLHNLMAARIASDKRYALRNRDLTIHSLNATEKRELGTVEELKEVLTNTFGIRLPESDILDETFRRVLQPR